MSPIGGVTIIGPGRAGLALGYALVEANAVTSLTVCGRRPEPPAHPLFVQGLATYRFGLERPRPDAAAVFLAVPDQVVPEMAHALAGHGHAPDGCAVFLLSGALSTEVLAPLHAQGYALGSFHPLQAIAHPVTGAERIPGSYLAVTGAPEAIAVARRLAAKLDSPILTVPEARRPLYHAAAVTAANFLPPLLEVATHMLERSGVPPDESLPALLPLVRGALANIEEGGLAAAVTGPVPRGDVETVEMHLRAVDPADRQLYALLGRALVRLCADRLDEDGHREMTEIFEKEIGS